MKFNTNNSEADEVIVAGFNSNDPHIQFQCIKFLRSILSRKDPEIERVIRMNVLPKILEIMLQTEDGEFQLECAWILTNLASGYEKGVDEIFRLNGTDHLKKLLIKSNDINVKSQCFWAFANISCENSRCRDYVLSIGILQDLVDFIEVANQSGDSSILKSAIWSLGNFYLARFPQLSDQLCHIGLNVFLKYFWHWNKAVQEEAIHGINNITENGKFIDRIVESGILKEIKAELESETCDRKIAAVLIQTIGSVCYGNDSQTQHVIDCGLIPVLMKFSGSSLYLKDLLWITSNIAAGPISQIMELMKAGVYIKVVEALSHNNLKVRREAVWTVNNATKSWNKEVVIHLVRLEVLKDLTTLLDDPTEEIVKATCDSIYNILMVGEACFKDVNLFAVLVEKYGALKKLEHLQIHPSWNIIEKSILILETFFQNMVTEVPKI